MIWTSFLPTLPPVSYTHLFLSRKYDITKHPNYKLLSDFNEKNAFNIEKFLSTRMPMRPGERYRNYEVTAEDLASQTL